MYKFKKECLIHSYKLPTGKIKSTSILHKPSGLRVERFFGVGCGFAYCSNTVNDIFVELKNKVEDYELHQALVKSRKLSTIQRDI